MTRLLRFLSAAFVLVIFFAWLRGYIFAGFGLPLLAFGLLWAAALWLFRLEQSERWTWGAVAIPEEPGARRRMLLLVSFASLFFELLVIRWISVEVRVFAYFKNLALIACFLGFGIGVYLARRRVQMLLAPLALVMLALVLRFPWYHKDALLRSLPQAISGFDDFLLWGTYVERMAWFGLRGGHLLAGLFVITMLFSLAALVFVPMGQAIGEILNREPGANLAYSLNVAASLGGIWFFTGLSALSLPPEIWFGLGLAALLPLWWRDRASLLAVLALSLVVVAVVRERDPESTVIWSPYQKLRLWVTHVMENRPARWVLEVNNAGYQQMLDHSEGFLARNPELLRGESARMVGYNLPFRFRPQAARVLIVGSGLGNDVAGALRNTGGEIVAVEIDPAIWRLGRQLHPERPYDSPRVRTVINDARNFFQTTNEKFDLIIFGLLDAHTLGSAYTNVRLDNYVYTRESLARAASLLNPGGVMVLKFQVDRDFIGERIATTLRDVFGRPPLCFYSPYGWSTQSTVFVGQQDGAATAALQSDAELAALVAARARHYRAGHTQPTTDDWPYLYHRGRSIPQVYLLLSVVLFVLTLLFLRQQAGMPARIEPHFFFLGLAFLLLEVQVISRLALFFGATWQVNSLVITAVLVMILLANLVAARWPGVRRAAYPALVATLLLTYLLPAEKLFFGLRWLDGLLLSALFTLPVFFAGLIFISSFERAAHREVAFGSNLAGAVAGGLLECLSFVIGVRALLLIAMAAYGASWITQAKTAPVPELETVKQGG